ncbi:hypothetical protein [Mucilaginibacter sp. KACC 22063]|uniref:hypothetical protein n=1 Tax=Mucilaginibacter sp. KACC 22063 TaxID=3025666 RepID=UPI002365FFDB|nr:hypothetical protein [Mucilaginibacter sp. KACC 22063]WDF54881.1 hypothetical protein PQ461_18285 [Mucilaginibacter sp. KACC 22063]
MEYWDYENGRSINLNEYFKNLDQGLRSEEAAAKTPTGKYANYLDYNQIRIIEEFEDRVIVRFYKNQSDTESNTLKKRTMTKKESDLNDFFESQGL